MKLNVVDAKIFFSLLLQYVPDTSFFVHPWNVGFPLHNILAEETKSFYSTQLADLVIAVVC